MCSASSCQNAPLRRALPGDLVLVLFEPEDERPPEVTVGDVFYVPRALYGVDDPKDGRPGVVVRQPTDTQPHVVILTRTSTGTGGVFHQADLSLQLDRAGYWEPTPYFILGRLFIAGVVLRGSLTGQVLVDILAMWERGL